MIVKDFIACRIGLEFLWDFYNKFKCRFRVDEPGDRLVFDAEKNTYLVPSDETVENIERLVTQSMESGKNLLAESYKDHKIVYDRNVTR